MVQRFYDTDVAPFAVEATIDAAGEFTEPTEFDARRSFNLSVSGSFVATVVLQRSFDNGATWHDVWSTSEPAQKGVENFEPDVLWRVGCKAGQYSSGTVNVRLSQ